MIRRAKVDIKDGYALITGCDSGFGRETAIKLTGRDGSLRDRIGKSAILVTVS